MKYKVATFEGLKSLPASVAILDASGTIVAVNDTWKQFGQRNGLRLPHSATGSNYLRYCRSDEPNSRRFASELRALLAGKRDLLTFIYPCHSRTQARWFCLIGLPLSLNKSAGVALLHVNLTAMLPLPIGARRARAKGEKEQIRLGTKFSRGWRRPGALSAGNALVTTEYNVHRDCHTRKGRSARGSRSGRSYSVEQTADTSPASAGRRQVQQRDCDGALSFAQHY